MEKKKTYGTPDESEVWKRKTLNSARKRKKFGKILKITLCVLTAAAVLAVAFAFFFDKA